MNMLCQICVGKEQPGDVEKLFRLQRVRERLEGLDALVHQRVTSLQIPLFSVFTGVTSLQVPLLGVSIGVTSP